MAAGRAAGRRSARSAAFRLSRSGALGAGPASRSSAVTWHSQGAGGALGGGGGERQSVQAPEGVRGLAAGAGGFPIRAWGGSIAVGSARGRLRGAAGRSAGQGRRGALGAARLRALPAAAGLGVSRSASPAGGACGRRRPPRAGGGGGQLGAGKRARLRPRDFCRNVKALPRQTDPWPPRLSFRPALCAPSPRHRGAFALHRTHIFQVWACSENRGGRFLGPDRRDSAKQARVKNKHGPPRSPPLPALPRGQETWAGVQASGAPAWARRGAPQPLSWGQTAGLRLLWTSGGAELGQRSPRLAAGSPPASLTKRIFRIPWN